MKKWVLLKDGVKIKYKDFPDYFSWEGRDVADGLEWYEVEKLQNESYNKDTQKLIKQEGVVNGKWRIQWVATDLSQQELESIQSQKQSAIQAAIRVRDLLGITTEQTKQMVKDIFECVQYLDELGE